MEKPRRSNRGIEENTLAILDSSADGNGRDILDDRLAFLEAVRSASLISDSSSVPSWEIYMAIFHILRDATSLEEATMSYQLLAELEKAWSPFIFGLENAQTEAGGARGSSQKLLDAYGFSNLIHDIAEASTSMDSHLRMKLVKDMLLFQYLMDVLEGDFLSRQTLYNMNMNWIVLRESLLCILLGSRKVNYRNMVRDCMTIIPGGFCHHSKGHLCDRKRTDICSSQVDSNCDAALLIALVEFERKTCGTVMRFLTLIMELDVHKKVADALGHTSRVDAVRIPLPEVVVDELSYNKGVISPFLKGFTEPKWKLEIILQYFGKYCSKPSVQTRRSNVSSSDDATLGAVLKHFSTTASTRNLVRKMTAEVAQLLLAHAFQAYVFLSHCSKNKETNEDNLLLQISKDLITSYENMKKNNRSLEILPFGKEALLTAATILALEP